MKNWSHSYRAAAACVAAAIVTSCSAAPQGNPAALPSLGGAFERAPGAPAQTLLYVSDPGANAVNIYAYPSDTLVTRMSYLNDPSGLCVDQAKHVWIVERSYSHVVEFAAGSKTPLVTLSDPSADLFGCSVDPTTGDLAVTNLGSAADGANVAVYAAAKGTPRKYKDGNLASAYFCAYDSAGNLFVDGIDGSGKFRLFELPHGASALKGITLDRSVGFPGGVAWEGRHLAVGDQLYHGSHESAIYHVTVSGSKGKVGGTTLLDGSCDVLQFAISGNTLIAPDACLESALFYHYPAGGHPTKQLPHFQYPVGAIVTQE